MENRTSGNSQMISAAKAGISERSGRDIDHNRRADSHGKSRSYRTRKDPFVDVWEQEIASMLKNGVFEATFVLEELQKKYPDQFPDSMLRTLQRKVKQWKALFGTDKEVMFRQIHEPGKLCVSDFTHPKEIEITIQGKPFCHIFYHFRLPYSGFNYMQVFAGSGESFSIFSQGLQEALRRLGGTPETHRTDSLSAAFKNLNDTAAQDLTERYASLAEHYGMKAARINRGESHENGTIESSHRHVKDRIKQSLIIRGSTDFSSLEEYQVFIEEVIKQHNRHSSQFIEAERAALRPLPATKAIDYTEVVVVVSCTSTIDVKRVTYTVPSRLIGERLNVRLYNDKLECYLGSAHALTLARMTDPGKGKRFHKIDYRHVIGSLVKKPAAFRGYRLRDALLPNDQYISIWNYADRTMSNVDACKFIVGLLHLAAIQNCEDELAQQVLDLINCGRPLKLSELQNRFNSNKLVIPLFNVQQHSLSSYNQFIPNHGVQ